MATRAAWSASHSVVVGTWLNADSLLLDFLRQLESDFLQWM
jgi:hypothetical protein